MPLIVDLGGFQRGVEIRLGTSEQREGLLAAESIRTVGDAVKYIGTHQS